MQPKCLIWATNGLYVYFELRMVQWLLWDMNGLHVYFELKTGQTITLRYERPKYLLWAMDDPNSAFELWKSQNVYFELRTDQMFTLNYKWLNVYLELRMVQCLLWAKNDPTRQNKDYKIDIGCFSAKHAGLKSKSKDWLPR